jgi:hypothetical protein
MKNKSIFVIIFFFWVKVSLPEFTDINAKGKVKMNGNTGTAGQVLTSNGTLAPTWNTLAAPLTTAGGQFFIDNNNVNDFNIALGAPISQVKQVDFGNIVYNTNADVSIDLTTNRINFNRTGLYEFEGIITFNMLSSQTQNATVSFNFVKSGTPRPYQFSILPNTGGTEYSKLINFKFMHRFNAGEFLSFTAGFSNMDTNPALIFLSAGQFSYLFGRYVSE